MPGTEPPRVLVIGGTAAYHLDLAAYAKIIETVQIETPYGIKSIALLDLGQPMPVAFLSRHGVAKLERIPTSVGALASIAVAAQLGARWILSWNGVGSCNRLLRVRDVVIPDALVDWTKVRRYSFGATHEPEQIATFDPAARTALYEAASGPRVFDRGVYFCTEGPRLETKAEIRVARRCGADVVGMTLSPEVWLAGELKLRYASLAIVTNMATGIDLPGRADPDFGPGVGERGLQISLAAAKKLAEE